MWARHSELFLGFWVALGPFVFRMPLDGGAVVASTFLCAAALVVLPLASYWPPLRRAPLLELVVAAWLIGFGWWRGREAPTPDAQSDICVGLLIAMLAIVPSRASLPPLPWRAEGPSRP
jgi:hypothetical protein